MQRNAAPVEITGLELRRTGMTVGAMEDGEETIDIARIDDQRRCRGRCGHGGPREQRQTPRKSPREAGFFHHCNRHVQA